MEGDKYPECKLFDLAILIADRRTNWEYVIGSHYGIKRTADIILYYGKAYPIACHPIIIVYIFLSYVQILQIKMRVSN